MSLPNVEVNVKDGALGRTLATDDGIGGMVLTGIAASGMALNVPKKIFSLNDAIALGITFATHPHAYTEISKYYEQTRDGAELYIMLVSEATTAAAVFVATTGPMDKLLTFAKGRITIAGNSMGRAVGYVATPTGILDFNLGTVAGAAQIIANAWAARHAPVRIILDGTFMIDPITGITNVKGAGDRIGVFVGSDTIGKRSSSMGRFLGRLASIPVHQSIARVKTGPFSAEAFLTTGKALEDYSIGIPDDLHNNGYMTLRYFNGKFGAFISDDLTLAPATSDFASLANGRVIDKAIRLVYQAYVDEINETIEITPEGNILPAKVSYLEDVLRKPLEDNMLAEGNCSKVDIYVNPAQNILSTSRFSVQVDIVPVGYTKHIIINLGFSNPALTA